MKCIKPKQITDAVLLSSSLTETEASVYNASTTYGIGDKCLVDHVIYTSLSTSNIGNYPPTDIAATSPHWSQGVYTNKWAMFDKYLNTKSVGGTSLTVTLDSGYCNAVALLNTTAESVDLEVKNSSNEVVFSTSVDLLSATIENWEQYFFTQRFWRDVAWIEFPLISSSSVTVTLNGTSPVSCGKVVLGEANYLGRSKWNISTDITDYSIFSTDSFGGVYISEGKYAKNVEGDVYIEAENLIPVDRVVNSLRATPTAFFCSNEYIDSGLSDYLVAYGLLKNFKVSIPRLKVSEYSFKITGII